MRARNPPHRKNSALSSTPIGSAGCKIIRRRLAVCPVGHAKKTALLKAGLSGAPAQQKSAPGARQNKPAVAPPADPLASALLQAFTEFPLNFPEADSARLTEKAKSIY